MAPPFGDTETEATRRILSGSRGSVPAPLTLMAGVPVDQEIIRVHPADRLAKGHGELRCLPVIWAMKACIIRKNGLSDKLFIWR